MDTPEPSQSETVKQPARDSKGEEGEPRWDERLPKVTGQKPVEDKSLRPWPSNV